MKISERRAGGFAYLWTLMLIAMLGAGLAAAGASYHFAMQRERERELLFIGREFREAIRSYYQSSGMVSQKEYPLRLEDLLKDPRQPGVKRHLRRIYRDPMTGKAEWGLVYVAGRIVGIHSLSTKEPIKQDGFERDEQSFRNKMEYREWRFVYPENLLSADSGQPQDAAMTDAMPADHRGRAMERGVIIK